MTDILAPFAPRGGEPEPPDLADRLRLPEQAFSDAAAAGQCLPEVLELLSEHPASEAAQVAAARLLEATRRRRDMLDTWKALLERFPGNRLALRMTVRWLVRAGREDEAEALVASRADTAPGAGSDLEARLETADLLAELKQSDAGLDAFRSILSDPLLPPRLERRVRAGFAKRLLQRGRLWEAGQVAAGLDAAAGRSPGTAAVLAGIARGLALARALPRFDPARENAAGAALAAAVAGFAGRRLPGREPGLIEGVLMVTGSLGAGGSERQMTHVAAGLRRITRAGQPLAGQCLSGPVQLAVTSISAEAGHDFFLPKVRSEGLDLTVLEDMPALGDDEIAALLPAGSEAARLLPLMPARARFGLERLLPLMLRLRPDVAYLWQDGAALTGALAALAAGVPRIVIGFRGLPPNLRPHLRAGDYVDLYQALPEVPGVVLSSNSRVAAEAYEDWLGLPGGSIAVVPNAVDPLPDTAGTASQALWTAFAARTAGASFTLGTVMRFVPNKRPDLWVACAARALERHPGLRFVMVGDGPGLDAAGQLAERLGIAGRILFAGNSPDVGFWLSKMDAFLLLSVAEGLPNVLIEAQLAGLPVISTPAGGAVETFESEVAGLVLPDAAEVTPDQVLSRLSMLVDRPDLRHAMGRFGQRDALERHATPVILRATMGLFTRPAPGRLRTEAMGA
jgi:glycosyltransferase involved in cell wall biosynthesis